MGRLVRAMAAPLFFNIYIGRLIMSGQASLKSGAVNPLNTDHLANWGLIYTVRVDGRKNQKSKRRGNSTP